MKAFQITDPLHSSYCDVQDPVPSAEDVVLQVRRVGLCGTDLSTFRGKNPLVSYPRVPGHEISATIVETGSAVPAHLHKGMNVAVLPYNNCGKCASCRRHRPNACLGAMSPYFKVHWQKLYSSATLGVRELTLVEPLAVGFHSVNRARIESSDVVAVIGCGTVGLGAMAGAAARGARVIALDVEDEKLALARKAGAKETINSRNADARAALKELTEGHGPDVMIEAVGTPDTFRFAVEEVAYTGRVTYVGYAKEPVAYETKLFILKELDILGSRNSATEFPAVISMLESGSFPVDATITTTVPFEEAGRALDSWHSSPASFTKILVSLSS
jgi:L-galactonate 5-dehydrogenase